MHKRGNSWYSDFWYKGKRYKKSWGPVSKTVAKEKDGGMRSDVASGKYVRRKLDSKFSVTIEEHLKRSKLENQKSTYERNKSIAEHLKEHFNDKRISRYAADSSLPDDIQIVAIHFVSRLNNHPLNLSNFIYPFMQFH